MRTFGLISPMAAGKGTVADYLVDKYGAKKYNFSGPINAILEKLYIPNARENQIKIGASMREQFGNDIWAQTLKKNVLADNPEIAVIDGIRYPEDLEISKTLPDFTLIAIETSADARYERMIKRNERPGEAEMDRATFDAQHNTPTEKNITDVMKMADVTIMNDGSVKELYEKIESIVNE